MSAAALLLAFGAFAPQSPTQPANRPATASACSQVSADALTDVAVGEICAGDDAARSPVGPFDSTARTRSWRTAADHYRRAATLNSKVATKVVALNALANIYDAAHLDDVTQMEATLRRQQPDAVEPYALLSARVQGVVIIEVVVNESGNVTQPKILRSIPLLDQAALDAVREWQFTPSMLNGKLVPVVMTTTVNFVLPPPAESAPPNR